MFATDGVEEVLGIAPRQLVSKSFYFCIQEQCLHDAVRCLERAKVNNSIAYLRFWYRNPLQDDNPAVSANPAAVSNNFDDNAYGNHPTNIGTAAALGPRMATTHETVTVPQHPEHNPIEIEAVVSCSSDGLVVVLRRARPSIPLHQTLPSPQAQVAANGIFASPWATHPIIPPYATQPMPIQTTWPPPDPSTIYPGYNHTYGSNPMMPPGYPGYPGHPGYPSYMNNGPGGPHPQDFLSTIRDVAVFAWGIVGINGSLEQYRRGRPSGDALPPDGIPIWNPHLEEGEFGLEEQEKEANIKVEAEQPEAVTRNEGLT
ncbi:uncharacterized protein BHQ10_006201 [Talaromyces amestolkiae]|uniref:PAS domain-containing protein n=1 Tax=Talaromyces amestolkiae TaxID=1196081 RepID=A0A364L302_TALAM|nr:uncharacterized protein BHQ10_006201 [Talaromyces amestolkiae]RAO70189.1 hypothetical protein BHQ10_006201 [Talaromyces amestolkiae]